MEQIDISYFAKTKPEAIDFADRIGQIINSIYQTGFNLDQALSMTVGMQKKDTFISLLRDHKVSSESVPELKTFLQEVQETALSLPILSLNLAFEPTQDTLMALSQWFLINIKKQILFDITIDPKMIAGVAISYQGRHLDFSIQKEFEKIVSALMNPKTNVPPATSQLPQQKVMHNPDNMHL